MTEIAEERAEDRDAVEALFDLAFAPGRANLSSYRLRAGSPPARALCLAAKDEFAVVVGAIRYWPIRIGQEGAGEEGAGQEGAGQEGAGQEGAGEAGAGEEGAGEAEAGEEGAPALLLGPVAVHPTRQSEGLGARLILESLERARAQGWRVVVLVGDEPYYGRFGFRRALAERIVFPEPTNPKRVLGLELAPGALSGVAGAARPWSAGRA